MLHGGCESLFRNSVMRRALLMMKGLKSTMNCSLPPNSTPLTRFCRILAMRVRARRASAVGGVATNPNPKYRSISIE